MKWDISDIISGKYAKKIILVVCAILILLFFYNIVDYFISSYRTKTLSESSAEPIIVKKPERPKIIEELLFGEYIPSQLDAKNVKESLINMEIVGILYSQNIQQSEVIIKDADGVEKNYLVGEELNQGITVKRIFVDGILIERNGELERLNLPKEKLIFQPTPEPLIEEKK